MNQSQVFQTKKPTRWNSVKWSGRIIAMIAIFFLVVLGIALYSGSIPSLPNLQAKARAYQNKLDPSNPLTLTTNLNKKYKGIKEFLQKKEKEDSLKKIKNPASENTSKLPYIRAAFYTPWTAKTSLPDLEKYGDKLNTIFPEWFFIDTTTFRLQTRIDTAG